MKLFLKYIKPYVYYYILGPIFMLVEVAGEIILPWLLSKIINVGAASHDVGYITRIGLVMVLGQYVWRLEACLVHGLLLMQP